MAESQRLESCPSVSHSARTGRRWGETLVSFRIVNALVRNGYKEMGLGLQ